MSFEIIDGFLPLDEYTRIKKLIHSNRFQWLWSRNAVSIDNYNDAIDVANNIDKKNFPAVTADDTFYFAHPFYMDYRPQSEYFEDIRIIFEMLDAKAIINARANLSVGGFNHWHCDIRNGNVNKTAIYCLGTCGATELHIDGEITRVETLDNRMIIFDSLTLHRAVYESIKDRRIVINLNYYD